MNAELNRKIQKLFEFEVPREPVQSTMATAVTQKLQSVWQGNLKQYAVVPEAQFRGRVKNFKQLNDNITKINKDMQRVTETDAMANKSKGIPAPTAATVDKMAQDMKVPEIGIIKQRYGELTIIVFDINNKPIKEEDKMQMLVKAVEAKAKQWGINKEQVYGILSLAYDENTNVANFYTFAQHLADTEKKATGITIGKE